MYSHTLSLSVLCFAVLCYPSGIAQILALIARRGNRNISSNYLVFGIVTMLINLSLVAIYIPYYDVFNFDIAPLTVVAGLVVGSAALFIEYGIGYLILKVKNKKVARRIAIHTNWSNADWKLWLETIVYAIIEEIIYRGAFAYIILNLLNLPVWVFVLISSLAYAVNHLRLGVSIVTQKLITGIMFATLYTLLGRNILSTMIAHVVQNVVILLIGQKGKKRSSK